MRETERESEERGREGKREGMEGQREGGRKEGEIYIGRERDGEIEGNKDRG